MPEPKEDRDIDVVTAAIGAIGILGALGGVALGAWLTGRNERRMLLESHRREDHQLRVDACVAFLVAYRRLIRYVLREDPEVVMSPDRQLGDEVFFVKGSREYVDAAHEALARLDLLEGGIETPIIKAAYRVRVGFRRVSVARAACPKGALPDDVVDEAVEAELAFARVASAELSQSATNSSNRSR